MLLGRSPRRLPPASPICRYWHRTGRVGSGGDQKQFCGGSSHNGQQHRVDADLDGGDALLQCVYHAGADRRSGGSA